MQNCANNCNCSENGKCNDCQGNCECSINNFVTLDLPSFPVLTGTITTEEPLSTYLPMGPICIDGTISANEIINSNNISISHPEYYGGEDNVYEAIKIIEHYNLDFHLGNVIKYILRAGVKNKDTLLEDYKKALWYLQRKIDQIEKKR